MFKTFLLTAWRNLSKHRSITPIPLAESLKTQYPQDFKKIALAFPNYIATVSYQSIRAATANPKDSLKEQ